MPSLPAAAATTSDLQHPRSGNAPSKRDRRRALLGSARSDENKQHADQHDVEQRRREGGDGEAAIGVEHAGIERDHRHEGEIRQRDAGEHHGEREFLRIAAEARRQQQHQPRHGDLGEDGEGDEQDHEAGKRLTGEGARRLGSLAMQALGEERNEGRIERAFGEQPAKHVGHAEGDEVGVGHRRGAEHGGDQHVAREAEHAAQDGHGADGGEAAIKLASGRQQCGVVARWQGPSAAAREWPTRGSCW